MRKGSLSPYFSSSFSKKGRRQTFALSSLVKMCIRDSFGNNTLKDVYDYEPVQKDWKPEYASLLMGVQGSMWTEFCNKPEDVDYLLFPRLAAVAAVSYTHLDVYKRQLH